MSIEEYKDEVSKVLIKVNYGRAEAYFQWQDSVGNCDAILMTLFESDSEEMFLEEKLRWEFNDDGTLLRLFVGTEEVLRDRAPYLKFVLYGGSKPRDLILDDFTRIFEYGLEYHLEPIFLECGCGCEMRQYGFCHFDVERATAGTNRVS